MSRSNESTLETRKRGETTILYHFTLQSHYQRSIEQHPQFYRPADKGDVCCARNPQQLQWLMDHLDWNLFDEQDRESDGLVLGIDPRRAFPSVESSGDQELPTLIFAIPAQAVVEKVVVPRKEAGFQVPVDLSIRSSLSLRQRLEEAAESVLYALILASILGLVLAVFPKIFPSESASQWLGYFWTNASFWVTLLVSMLVVTGFIYLLLGLSRSKVQEALKEKKLGLAGEILRGVERLDPGPNVLGTWVFFILGVALFAIAGLGISMWYRYTPLPPVQFRIGRSGETSYIVLANEQISLPPKAVREIRVPLPPNVTRPSCRWSTAVRSSLIYEQANCQAVYWLEDTTGQDRVLVEVYQDGRQLTRASFTVAVEPEEP
jgi:hypothetical protein